MTASPMFGSNLYYQPSGYPYSMPSPVTYPSTTNIRGVLSGRSVADINEVAANELPMDGSLAIFPKTDGSAIYARSLNGDMSVNTRVYIPAPEDYEENQTVNTTPEVSNADVMQAIADLANQFSNIQTIIENMNKNNSYSKSRNNNQRRNNQNNSHQNEGDDVNA